MARQPNSRDDLEPNTLVQGSSPYGLDHQYTNGSSGAAKPAELQMENGLSRYPTAGSYVPMEVFEKMYLNPQGRVHGHLRSTFGNPTPLALMGFLIASTPLGCNLMGWRGAGGGGAAIVGVFYSFGGLLQIIGSIMEWIIGNTFPFVVFGSYGAFWITLGMTLTPQYNAMGAYTTSTGNSLSPGTALTTAQLEAGTAEFDSSFAFYLVFIALLTFFYFICSFRTNVIFVLIFFFLDIALCLLAGSYWKASEGSADLAGKLQIAAGAFVFVFCIFAWYLLLAQLLASLDFRISLPVFDLSTKIKGAKDVEKEKREQGAKQA